MNLPSPLSIDTLLRDLFEAMALFGRNKSKYPFDLGYHDSRWWVTVELNTSLATIDFETKDESPTTALQDAIARVRREARIRGAKAAA